MYLKIKNGGLIVSNEVKATIRLIRASKSNSKAKGSNSKSAEGRLLSKVAEYTIDQYGPYKFLEETWTGDQGQLAEVKDWLNKAPRISFNVGNNGNGQSPEVEMVYTKISKAIYDLTESVIPNAVGRPKKAY